MASKTASMITGAANLVDLAIKQLGIVKIQKEKRLNKMTNSNENELKVGSCVSWLNSHGWSYDKIQSEYELREFTKQVLGTFEWIFGIHPSLLPDGFCLSKIEYSETQHSLSIENTSLRKELEVAQKEIGKLQTQLGWARSNVEDSQKQIDRLSRDAERYQYLRSKSLETINEGGVFAGMTPENLILNGTDLDEAIDNEIVDEALLNAAMTLCDDLHDIEAAPKSEDC